MKGVVNHFIVVPIDESVELDKLNDTESTDIYVHYFIDDRILTHSQYFMVSKNKIDRIQERLEDYTSTNQEETELCRTIPLISMIDAVENIIFDRHQRKAK